MLEVQFRLRFRCLKKSFRNWICALEKLNKSSSNFIIESTEIKKRDAMRTFFNCWGNFVERSKRIKYLIRIYLESILKSMIMRIIFLKFLGFIRSWYYRWFLRARYFTVNMKQSKIISKYARLSLALSLSSNVSLVRFVFHAWRKFVRHNNNNINIYFAESFSLKVRQVVTTWKLCTQRKATYDFFCKDLIKKKRLALFEAWRLLLRKRNKSIECISNFSEKILLQAVRC